MVLMNMLTIGLIIFLKFALPVMIPFVPFLAGWGNFVLDTIDGDLLIPLGLADTTYQPIDKIADWATYIGMVVLAYKMRWPFKTLVMGLFVFRSIGQLLFLLTRKELVFFLFPNFLEPFFLIVVSMLAFQRVVRRHKQWREQAYQAVFRYKWLIGLFVVVYKMQDEYITHVGNIDRSELIQRLFGG